MNDLPRLFRQLFTIIYGLITFTFVALVAYAATAGAFGSLEKSGDRLDDSKCRSGLVALHNDIVSEARAHMEPYVSERLMAWSRQSQDFNTALEELKSRCTGAQFRTELKGLGRLNHAYTSAIRSFDNLARNTLLELQPTFQREKN